MQSISLLQKCQTQWQQFQSLISIKDLEIKISDIDQTISNPNFWQNPQSTLLKDRQAFADLVKNYQEIDGQLSFYQELYDASPNDLEDYLTDLEQISLQLSGLIIRQTMKDPNDICAAIITISSGAGGLESSNWVSMMLRMYLRFADQQGFTSEILDEEPSKEHSTICIDQVSIRIEGPYAYGLLKRESGVHRLIRNSPFSSSDARHTSFCAVSVTPDVEDIIDIKIEEKDIEISTMRASGNGGQSINKVESAVRIVHLPTGMVINSRGESSQHSNRRTAMKMLKAKLYLLEEEKRKSKQDQFIAAQQSSSFGHQIRTYTLTPFQLVKDHRSGFETNQTDNVLDGNLLEIINSNLK